jgi:hypothetical protein
MTVGASRMTFLATSLLNVVRQSFIHSLGGVPNRQPVAPRYLMVIVKR